MMNSNNKERIVNLLKKMSPLEKELMEITLNEPDYIEHERLYATVLAFQRVYCALYAISKKEH